MRVGIIGGGQLGAMLAEAANPLGLERLVLDPRPAPCASRVAEVLHGDFDDPVSLDAMSEWADVITYEFENVPLASVRGRPGVLPPPQALEMAQDRLVEKRFFARHGVATALFAEVSKPEDIHAALVQVGVPAILKTRRMGYDGKGQALVHTVDEAREAFHAVGEVPCILEGMVPFARELSVIAVRGRNGQVRCWPVAQNHHEGGILRWSVMPAEDAGALQVQAEGIATRLLEALEYVGVLTVELFEVDGGLVANEMAPRVHNSGHATMEGAVTSQFENHLRAIVGWPLGCTDVPLPVGLVNVIGEEPPIEELLAVEGVRVHRYGKRPRPGRKLGHVTVLGPDRTTVMARMAQVRALMGATPAAD